MNRNMLMLSLAVLGLTWVADQFATIARIQNTRPFAVRIYTQSRRCGQEGWGFRIETIQPGHWIDLCSGVDVRADIILDGNLGAGERPIFMEKGRNNFSYTLVVPQHADWVVYIVDSQSAGGNIQGKGWLTQKTLDELNKGKTVDSLTPEFFTK